MADALAEFLSGLSRPLTQVERNRRWREKNAAHYRKMQRGYMKAYRARKRLEKASNA